MNTNFFKRIDDLGRIVIPKEIRRKLHISDGDMMEISVSERTIVVKPYIQLSEATHIIENGLRALTAHGNIEAVVTTKQEIFSSKLKELPQYTRLTDEMRELICQRREFVADGSLDILVAYTSEKFTLAMFPIYNNCELYGSLIIVGNKGDIPSEATVEKGRLLADIISAALGVGE